MADAPNPFRPGFAERPLVLAGREEVLAAGEEAITVGAVDRRTPMPLLVVGPRGVGKTVVLDELSRRAGERYGWPRVWVEASPSASLGRVLEGEAEVVRRVVTETRPESARHVSLSEAVLRAGVLGVGGEVHFALRDDRPRPADHHEFAELLGALADRDSGLVLVVDEAQAARPDDFTSLASRLQRAVGESLPLVTLIAGLPALRRRTSEVGQSLGYLERADWHELGSLSPDETRLALEATAAQGGRPIEPGASAMLVEASGGYPYAVQVIGKHAWRSSRGALSINPGHARAALAPAQRELERNLYHARWAQAPARERAYMQVVAELVESGRAVTGRAVADRLGTTTRAVSTTRARLLSRGTLLARGEELEFMVPGMAAWVRRQQHGDREAIRDRTLRAGRGPQPGIER